MSRRSAVAQFAISGLLATLLIGLIAVAILRHLGTQEAIRDAKQVTRLAGEGIVEPAITPGILAGDAAALRRLDRTVRAHVRRDGIVRVKLWAADGRVIYSDERRLVGQRFPLAADETTALAGHGVEAEVSDLSRPENRFERSEHKLLEVYVPIHGPDGRPLMFEAYQRFGSVSASGRRLWQTFAPALIGGLILLQLINLPLARSLARRLRQASANARRCSGARSTPPRPSGARSRPTSTMAWCRTSSACPTRWPRSEACFIDADGEELARVVRGRIARPSELSTREEQTVFFAPTFALKPGQVHQTKPYVSPDTKEWVVANATLIPQPHGRKRAIVHFEVTVESFRRAMGASSVDSRYGLRVVDGHAGNVLIDGERPQRVDAPLGSARDARFAALAHVTGRAGVTEIAGRRTAYRRIASGVGNGNDWIITATAPSPTGSALMTMGPAPIAMLALALVIIVLAGLTLRSARRELEAHASTDSLTGLGNRRKLLADLDRRVRTAHVDEPVVLTMFDLNGFKNYNDTFGHPAGDALLLRLGSALAAAIAPFGGRAYRPGGDEFCVIAPAARRHAMEESACGALSETGEGFAISTAFGSAVIPLETGDASEALRKADAAMYAQKQSGRAGAGRQSSDVLLRALAERHPDLGEHIDGVAELAGQIGARLRMDGDELDQLRHAAALHDIGKVAVPDAIIDKPGPLTADEWVFMRRHTLIGERIIAAAPALGAAARLVRSSHEAWDGRGYPDGLEGVEIPLGARLIAVCDAFDAMISDRPYAAPRTIDEALAELRRCAGTQFDPAIVAEFEHVLADRARSPAADAV